MLWVLQETIWRKRSSPGTSASSLMPIANIFPKPNSLPCARKPWGPETFSYTFLFSLPAGVQSMTTVARSRAAPAS